MLHCSLLYASITKNNGKVRRKTMKKKILALVSAFVLCFSFAGCTTQKNNSKADENTQESTEYVSADISVAALKGPTAIGMVKLMKDNKEGKAFNNYDFTIAGTADEFSAKLIKGDIQIAAMPCNAAATLYNKSNGKVSIIGINTLGVLYILDTGNSVNSVADLKGKTIYTTGKGTTPEYTLRYLLKSNNIDPDKDVTIEFKSEAAEVAAVMASSSDETIAMLPQPYATTVLMNNQKARIALDVTKEWENKSNGANTVVTGVIVVNTDYYNSNKANVDKFMEEYKTSVEFVNANVDEAASYVEEFDIFKAAVAKKAIPNCNITFITGDDMKNKVSSYLKVLYDSNPASVGGKMPEDNFYIK